MKRIIALLLVLCFIGLTLVACGGEPEDTDEEDKKTEDKDNEDEENEDEGEVLILEIGKDENGEDVYVSVEDEEVSQTVFDKFIALMDEEEDAE